MARRLTKAAIEMQIMRQRQKVSKLEADSQALADKIAVEKKKLKDLISENNRLH